MRVGVGLLIAVLGVSPALAQVDCDRGLEPLDPRGESPISPTDFVRDIASNEVLITKALGEFGYTLQIVQQTLLGDQVDGEFRQTLKVTFDGAARRVEPIGPIVNTLTRVRAPAVDIDALHNAFTLTPDLMARRDIVFAGRQRLGEFNAHVFDALPRDSQGVTGFAGRTWVRGRNSQIARFCGQMEDGPFGDLRYLVERMWVADKYWFPSRIAADEKVAIDGKDVRVRVELQYSGYQAR